MSGGGREGGLWGEDGGLWGEDGGREGKRFRAMVYMEGGRVEGGRVVW